MFHRDVWLIIDKYIHRSLITELHDEYHRIVKNYDDGIVGVGRLTMNNRRFLSYDKRYNFTNIYHINIRTNDMSTVAKLPKLY